MPDRAERSFTTHHPGYHGRGARTERERQAPRLLSGRARAEPGRLPSMRFRETRRDELHDE